MDEIIALLLEVRTDLILLKTTITSKDIKEQLKWAINGIDIVGCELTQNIAKKLKEKQKEKINHRKNAEYLLKNFEPKR